MAGPGACNPSRTALLTGLRPSSTGVYFNSNPWRPVLPDVIKYFTFLGGFTITIISVVIPSMLNWKVSKKPYFLTAVSVCMGLAGFASAVLTLIGY